VQKNPLCGVATATRREYNKGYYMEKGLPFATQCNTSLAACCCWTEFPFKVCYLVQHQPSSLLDSSSRLLLTGLQR
jgi:hypothetical protein